MDCFGHLIQCTIRICKNKILLCKHFLETEARSRGCDLPSRTHHGTRFFLSVDRNIYYNFYSTTIHLFVQSKRDLNDFLKFNPKRHRSALHVNRAHRSNWNTRYKTFYMAWRKW